MLFIYSSYLITLFPKQEAKYKKNQVVRRNDFQYTRDSQKVRGQFE